MMSVVPLQTVCMSSVENQRKPDARARPTANYESVRRTTERLCEDLSPEDCVPQSMLYASPVKWHIAHVTWFFETFVLETKLPGYQPFHPQYRILFNSYYNTVGAQHPRPLRGLLTRPSLTTVFDYRRHVDDHMMTLIEGGVDEDTADVIELGLHHEQQHQELLLMDVKHLFYANPMRPAYRRGKPQRPSREPGALKWLDYEGGVADIGAGCRGFAFDNERPRHSVLIDGFALANRPILNGEFRHFIDDDGYRRPELWLSDGWDRIRDEQWSAPLYWEQSDGEWQVFTLCGMQRLDDARPLVHCSYYEADAYARWAGARLPTEAEWERAAADVPIEGNFLEDEEFAPNSVEAVATGRPRQLFGDVWEWTQSPYTPYPGYLPVAGALGEYNGKFMCNQMVLRGGACVSPRLHVRKTYRNFFPPELRWQFGGFRLARDLG